MAGTKEGGKAAAITNKKRYGDDFYKKLGTVGGKNGRTGGFAAGEEGRARARKYGAIGGRLSRRGKSLLPRAPKTTKPRPATAVDIVKPKPASQPLVRLSAAARERIEADKARRIDVRSA